jgi:hypothetical protein
MAKIHSSWHIFGTAGAGPNLNKHVADKKNSIPHHAASYSASSKNDIRQS